MSEKPNDDLISIGPGGVAYFHETTVPVAHLFDYLERGYNVEQFVRRFAVRTDHVKRILNMAKDELVRVLEIP